MAEIPPLKSRVALKFDDGKYYILTEALSAKGQKDIDISNGEVEIDGYSVFNIKAGLKVNKSLSFNIGVDNIGDKTYAVNNTYVGRGLIVGDNTSPLLLNEPGRFLYANISYKF